MKLMTKISKAAFTGVVSVSLLFAQTRRFYAQQHPGEEPNFKDQHKYTNTHIAGTPGYETKGSTLVAVLSHQKEIERIMEETKKETVLYNKVTEIENKFFFKIAEISRTDLPSTEKAKQRKEAIIRCFVDCYVTYNEEVDKETLEKAIKKEVDLLQKRVKETGKKDFNEDETPTLIEMPVSIETAAIAEALLLVE